jgi:hypothetical protein
MGLFDACAAIPLALCMVCLILLPQYNPHLCVFIYFRIKLILFSVITANLYKARLPEKIKIFIWLLEQKAILTKDNMIKRKWQGAPDCYFCGEPEDCDHLMFLCPIARVVWGVIAICFHQKTRPVSYDQFWLWIERALPKGGSVYILGLASICWAI